MKFFCNLVSWDHVDLSLFVIHHDDDIIILLLFVDDIVLTRSNPSLLELLISKLSPQFSLKDI